MARCLIFQLCLYCWMYRDRLFLYTHMNKPPGICTYCKIKMEPNISLQHCNADSAVKVTVFWLIYLFSIIIYFFKKSKTNKPGKQTI